MNKRYLNIQIIGDPHGNTPKLSPEADLIIITGDFFGNKKYSNLYKKYLKTRNYNILKNANIEKLEKITYKNGKKVIKELLKQNKLIYYVKGNWDKNLNKTLKELKREGLNLNNFQSIETSPKFIKNTLFIGTKFIHPLEITKTQEIEFIQDLYDYLNYQNIKKKIISIIKKNKDKHLILVSHNAIYNTNQDISNITFEHIGSKLTKEIIKTTNNCILTITGHIHEGFNIEYYNQTLCINAGNYHNPSINLKLDTIKGKILNITFYDKTKNISTKKFINKEIKLNEIKRRKL